jgi:hydrogenase maturation protein HypF
LWRRSLSAGPAVRDRRYGSTFAHRPERQSRGSESGTTYVAPYISWHAFGDRMPVRKRIHVSGIVQGVGFRPYVYRLAAERRLTGQIANTAAGAVIEVQGAPEAVDEFLALLPAQAPPLALITDVRIAEIECHGDDEFRILPSQKSETVRTLIPPDMAVCGDCLRELFDPTDRRYLYPFINCTNCGPRFTIVRGIPYDRPQTSMAAFPMCARCRAEYEDPQDRRFHAQPNACWDCGPQVELWNARGQLVSASDPLGEAAALLRDGSVLAVKGLGGFHLAVDATNPNAVEQLRARKHRVEKPFAVMVPDLETAAQLCELDTEERDLLSQPQRPVVLLRCQNPSPIADAVAPFNLFLGIFLPYTPLHYLLLEKSRLQALVMTSANLSEEPIVRKNSEAATRLAGVADFFLVHNREILRRCDDSVVRRVGGRVRQLRRSRGFVPVPVFLDRKLPATLAVGGELKNTLCLTKGRQAFLSQHIGDLENVEAHHFFREAVEHLQNILEIRPSIVAYDLHPDYFSTRWALASTAMKAVGVQHHHAHIASCMAENHLQGRVIGLALDGTGYGTDGQIWGGEVLLADYVNFERAAHFAYVALPGGSAAIREPWRTAASFLLRAYGPELVRLPIPFLEQIPLGKIRTVLRMVERHVNSPLTSSCGRLFDGVAALINLRHEVNYEAQAAIELEMCRDESVSGQPYLFAVYEEDGVLQIDPAPVFRSIVEDVLQRATQGQISQRFHEGLVEALGRVAHVVRERTSLNRVCLSGGSFQNVYLAIALERKLVKEGFEVFTHSEVPPGDGGLSLGQAVVAAHRAAS